MEVSFRNVNYKFFWKGVLSNWHLSDFVVDGIKFNCGEQYMMYAKAILFNDKAAAAQILEATKPSVQKDTGRRVEGFDSAVWDPVKYELVKKGLREKFLQNDKLKLYLKSFAGYILVEASPFDTIWGIGFDEKSAIENFDRWGENLLGKILTDLSIEL